MLISKLLTALSIILFLAFIVWLIYDASHAPTIPSGDDPDYYPTYDPNQD